ncbi:hypothetical protein Taro_047764, partial [Colocasia esculenta]|nr:hypothetical protein [Colocasia esculenta]
IRSHWQPVTTLPERNLGAGPKISESDLVLTGSKCRFRIWDSQAVPITARKISTSYPRSTTIGVLVHTLRGCNFGSDTEFLKTSVLSTVSECRFRIVLT